MNGLNLKNWNPFLILRFGLGATFLYAGISVLSNPGLWKGFAPNWIGDLVSLDIFLSIHGVFEIVLGVLLILGLFEKFASFLAFLDLLAILIFSGVDAVTFRDLGLVATSLALFVHSYRKEASS